MNRDKEISSLNTPQAADPDGGTAPVGKSDDGVGNSGETTEIQRIVSFSAISGGTAEVIIEHEGHRYRLRVTRNGRLLLNK